MFPCVPVTVCRLAELSSMCQAVRSQPRAASALHCFCSHFSPAQSEGAVLSLSVGPSSLLSNGQSPALPLSLGSVPPGPLSGHPRHPASCSSVVRNADIVCLFLAPHSSPLPTSFLVVSHWWLLVWAETVSFALGSGVPGQMLASLPWDQLKWVQASKGSVWLR